MHLINTETAKSIILIASSDSFELNLNTSFGKVQALVLGDVENKIEIQ